MNNDPNNILNVKDFSVQFESAPEPVVRNISFSLPYGKTVALVGESGSGKSITALSLLGLNRHVRYLGEIMFSGKSLLNNPNWQAIRGREISFIFQEPMTALNPLHSIRKQLAEVINLHNKAISPAECLQKIHELCDEVELGYIKSRLTNYPHQLSGGERQRLMIAMAIANRPKLLIADEPTTALDVSTQAKIMDLLCRLQQKHNMSLLLITHDLHLVRHFADELLVMKSGELVESGNTAQIFSAPQHDYTKQLLGSIHADAPNIATNDNEILLKCADLQVDYQMASGFLASKKPKIALYPTNFHLAKGQTLGIVGESGSGKTSLGLAVARLISSHGEINFKGSNLHDFSVKQMRQARSQLQFVFQDPFSSLNPRMNIEQIVTEGLDAHFTLSKSERIKRLDEILLAVGLPINAKHRYPHEFSGGQRQRINIARAMILRPALIIFDEPTSALDITLQTQIITLLKELQQQNNTSYIFISHDIRSIKSISHHIIVLQHGKIVEIGAASQVLHNPQHDYTQMLIAATN